jgi:hypothetical protein
MHPEMSNSSKFGQPPRNLIKSDGKIRRWSFECCLAGLKEIK